MIADEENPTNVIKGSHRRMSNSPSSPENERKIVAMDGVSRDVIDPIEDSGFSSTSGGSSFGAESDKDQKLDGTIGNGIKFVDPQLIAEEQRLKLAKKKTIDKEKAEQKRAAREAFEEELQEQQYKCLMHLLKESKALTSFIMKKCDDKEKKVTRKHKLETPDEDESKPKKGKFNKTKTPKKLPAKGSKIKKLNLSEEDIKEELEDLSDGESTNKEVLQQNVTDFQKPKYFLGELRDYQKAGLNWLKLLYENGLNGILADEMGLGKTIQVIALFSYLMEKHIPGPYMIIVPLSTLPNWVSEFEKFAPELPVVVYYGNPQERNAIKPKIERKVQLGNFYTYPIVLMTFQMPLFDANFLTQFHWRYIVIDEAQRIKNFESQLFKAVKTYRSMNRLLLTGTPLQNNLTELWSLLNFLLPDIFNNLNVFQTWFDAKEVQSEHGKKKFFQQEQKKKVLATLREILHPFMLRRLKIDVCPDIPPIKEVIIYTPLTSIQYELYSAIINKDIGKFHKVEEPVIVDVNGVRPKRKCRQKVELDDVIRSRRMETDDSYDSNDSYSISNKKTETVGTTEINKEHLKIWNQVAQVTEENVKYFARLRFSTDIMLYRHVVNHPYLIHFPLNDCGQMLVDEKIIHVSGKLLVLDAMLKKLKAGGHKVLLFSTMTMVLDIIEDFLSLRPNYKYVRLDGNVKYDARRQNIDLFQTDENVFLFLLTTKAGAVGLNLAAADTVIIYDSDWNPQNDLQAMARCHRIGQTKPVVVYRLCTKGTVDEEIIRRANAKRFLEKAVISTEANLVNSEEGLMKLKKLLDGESFTVADSKNNVYTDSELDDLLDRSDL